MDNMTIIFEDSEYRVWSPVQAKDRTGKLVTMQLCEEFIEGRWEPYYTILSR